MHLNGTFNVTRLAIPHLWGLMGLTKTLSIELGEHGIRVNAVAPGAVGGQRFARVLEGRAKRHPQG